MSSRINAIIAAILLIVAFGAAWWWLVGAKTPEPNLGICPLCERFVQPPSSFWKLHPLTRSLR